MISIVRQDEIGFDIPGDGMGCTLIANIHVESRASETGRPRRVILLFNS